MVRVYLPLAWLISCAAAQAQQKAPAIPSPASDTIRVRELEEVVVSASKFEEKRKNIAQKIDIITFKSIAEINAQNTGDLLIQTGNVFVQKSQQGGSSPVLRGFEASRVLLVIDGVRMNNAIYRSGHLQNVITIDQNALERVEVQLGPASTLYGSDALGGILHLRTKDPKLSNSNTPIKSGTGFVRYSSANQEKSIHADASIGSKKWGWFQSYTFSDFGDLRMGNRYPDRYPDFGRRGFYIRSIGGIDSVVPNPDDRLQRYSGYRQWDLLQKVLFKPTGRTSHTLNLQYSNTNHVPRYDRLQDIRNGTLRFAEWYYGPQLRMLGSYQYHLRVNGLLDELTAQIHYQHIQESRQTREYRRYDRFDSRREALHVWGFSVDGRKKKQQQELTLGMDGQFNKLRSVADRTNLNTGAVTALDTRYPNGRNSMNFLAVYAQHIYKFRGGKLVLNDGLRLQGVWLQSRIADNSFFNLPFTRIRQDHVSATGNLGWVYTPAPKSRISLSLASAFRAPNIDDLAKIFESSTAAKQVVFPNPDIKPEYTYNVDLSGRQQIGESVILELTGFYTLFRNALVKAPFRINGLDSVLFDGVRCQVLANQNRNKAYLSGFSASLTVNIMRNLILHSTLSYTRGRYETDPAEPSLLYQKQSDGSYQLVKAAVSSKPLDHIPPVFGKTSLRYESRRWQVECFSLYNGWKRLDQYNADGEDNAQYATADGMPSWWTLNFRGSVQVHRNTRLQLALENIMDRNYRYFASGFSAPGRNVMVAFRTTF